MLVPAMNTLAPARGTPASLVTRPVTVVPLWANAVETVNANAVMADKNGFGIPFHSPCWCDDRNVRVSTEACKRFAVPKLSTIRRDFVYKLLNSPDRPVGPSVML